MKKIILSSLFVLFAFIVGTNAQAQGINVSSASYFKALYQSGGTVNIDLANSLTFDNYTTAGALGAAGNNLNMTVDLKNYTLSFSSNSNGSGGGVMFSSVSKSISFDNGTIKFTNNSGGTSGGGGAIHNSHSSTISFINAQVDFTSNNNQFNIG
jgi:predicted outer membrane repeat protein